MLLAQLIDLIIHMAKQKKNYQRTMSLARLRDLDINMSKKKEEREPTNYVVCPANKSHYKHVQMKERK